MIANDRGNRLTLVCLDIGAHWNVPLLENAATISGARTVFATASAQTSTSPVPRAALASIKEIIPRFDQVLTCETAQRSQSIFEYPAPRGHTALIVGNEKMGVPGELLRMTDRVVSIPMHGKGMSSVNVAVAAAVALYVLKHDLVRKGQSSHTDRWVPPDS